MNSILQSTEYMGYACFLSISGKRLSKMCLTWICDLNILGKLSLSIWQGPSTWKNLGSYFGSTRYDLDCKNKIAIIYNHPWGHRICEKLLEIFLHNQKVNFSIYYTWAITRTKQTLNITRSVVVLKWPSLFALMSQYIHHLLRIKVSVNITDTLTDAIVDILTN